MGYVNDRQMAEDLAQETFVSVWENLSGFRGEATIGTWIYRIASNHCLRQIEQNDRRQMSDLPEQLTSDIPTDDRDVRVKQLYAYIAELPEMDRIIISLELEEIDQAEIAKITGMSHSNIRVKVYRIKKKLKKKFADDE